MRQKTPVKLTTSTGMIPVRCQETSRGYVPVMTLYRLPAVPVMVYTVVVRVRTCARTGYTTVYNIYHIIWLEYGQTVDVILSKKKTYVRLSFCRRRRRAYKRTYAMTRLSCELRKLIVHRTLAGASINSIVVATDCRQAVWRLKKHYHTHGFTAPLQEVDGQPNCPTKSWNLSNQKCRMMMKLLLSNSMRFWKVQVSLTSHNFEGP